jgi:hypothetical protein
MPNIPGKLVKPLLGLATLAGAVTLALPSSPAEAYDGWRHRGHHHHYDDRPVVVRPRVYYPPPPVYYAPPPPVYYAPPPRVYYPPPPVYYGPPSVNLGVTLPLR